MARSSLTREKRARRYLQASMSAGYSGLPAEHREAYEAQMRSHERAYPGVRNHALAGASADFDKALSAGEREHQRALREREGLQERDVQRMRKELRAGAGAGARPPARRANPTYAGPRAARRAARAGGQAVSRATGGGGNTLLYFIGVALGLSLLYLLVNEKGKGPAALTGIVGAIGAGVTAFIEPKDPIAAAERALGAAPPSSGSAPSASSSSASGPLPGTVASTKGSGYVAPFSGATPGRVDQGQDFTLQPGAPIRAIGPGKVTEVVPNWFKGQPLIGYELTAGPAAGRTVYVAEQITPVVKVGQTLAAGQVIGHYAKSGTGIEIGWGSTKQRGKTFAQATSGYVEGEVTAAGKAFSGFLSQLGVRTR